MHGRDERQVGFLSVNEGTGAQGDGQACMGPVVPKQVLRLCPRCVLMFSRRNHRCYVANVF